MTDRRRADTLARSLAAQQHGLVSRWQLRDWGLDADRIHRLVRSATWAAVSEEVHRLVGAPRTTGQRVAAAVLDAGPGAALSHRSAGRWWGLQGCSLVPVEVVRTSPTSRRCCLAATHRVRVLPERWVTVLDGVRVVRPELLAMQLFAVHRFERAERLVERLWADRLLSGASVAAFLEGYGRRGRNGTAGLRRYLEARGEMYVPTGSGVESRAVQILEEAGIAVRRQVDVGSETQWTGRVDLRVLGRKVLIEIQSERHHSALVDRRADAERLERLRRAGFVVVELTDTEVWTRPATVVTRVRDALSRPPVL